jgi:signal transduction histidine kinase
VVRRLPAITVAVAVLGAAFGAAVLPRPFTALAPALGAGLLAQLAATWVMVRMGSRPYAGMAAVATVASLLVVIPSPWQELVAAQAVPWVPLALAWSTVRAVENSPTPRQLRLSGLIALAYVLVAGSHGHGSGLTAAMSAAVPILGGLCASLAQRLNRARHDRLAALARERAAVARTARADERRRLAAGMHDTLGHVLTLLVLHANALTVRTSDPVAGAAAEQMSRLGNEGLAALRSLLDLLSEPGAVPAEAPVPAEDLRPSLESLAGEARTAGQAVDLVWEGDDTGLAPVLARTVHRTVQEGLTNARRHAPGGAVTVVVTLAEDTVGVVVRNGPGTAPGHGPGTGRGLDGVRRRVALLGGDCTHAPTADGGYALRTELPQSVRTTGTGRGPS